MCRQVRHNGNGETKVIARQMESPSMFVRKSEGKKYDERQVCSSHVIAGQILDSACRAYMGKHVYGREWLVLHGLSLAKSNIPGASTDHLAAFQ
jgi:hypothetical protein